MRRSRRKEAEKMKSKLRNKRTREESREKIVRFEVKDMESLVGDKRKNPYHVFDTNTSPKHQVSNFLYVLYIDACIHAHIQPCEFVIVSYWCPMSVDIMLSNL